MTSGRWAHALAVALIVCMVSACSAESTPTSSDPVEPPDGGSLADFMNGSAPSHFADVELPRNIATDRMRVMGTTEDAFLNAVREDPGHDVAASVFDGFDGEATVYLGYLYCVARDAGAAIDRSVAAVVDVVARANGRDPSTPANEDFVAAVTIVNHASGSLCPETFVDTNAFLKDLTGSQ